MSEINWKAVREWSLVDFIVATRGYSMKRTQKAAWKHLQLIIVPKYDELMDQLDKDCAAFISRLAGRPPITIHAMTKRIQKEFKALHQKTFDKACQAVDRLAPFFNQSNQKQEEPKTATSTTDIMIDEEKEQGTPSTAQPQQKSEEKSPNKEEIEGKNGPKDDEKNDDDDDYEFFDDHDDDDEKKVTKKRKRGKKINEGNGEPLNRKASLHLWRWLSSRIKTGNVYPTQREKEQLAFECNCSIEQVNVWFCNKRSRIKKSFQ